MFLKSRITRKAICNVTFKVYHPPTNVFILFPCSNLFDVQMNEWKQQTNKSQAIYNIAKHLWLFVDTTL